MEEYYIITIESFDIPITGYETIDKNPQFVSKTEKKITFRSNDYLNKYMDDEVELLRKISKRDDRSLELTIKAYVNDEKLYIYEYNIISGNVTYYCESESESDYSDYEEEKYEEYEENECEFINSKGEKCYIVKQWEVDELDNYIKDLTRGFNKAQTRTYNKNREILQYNKKIDDLNFCNENKKRVISGLNSSLNIYRREIYNIEEINRNWNTKLYFLNFLLITSNVLLFYYK